MGGKGKEENNSVPSTASCGGLLAAGGLVKEHLFPCPGYAPSTTTGQLGPVPVISRRDLGFHVGEAF